MDRMHYLEDSDIEYTPTHDLHAVRAYDSTIEIVGFVEAIEATQIVGVQRHKIFKFWVSNDDGEKVQIVTWNAEVGRVEVLIRINHIVHIDGAYCKPTINRKFNRGTVDYELIIQSNTVINILRKHRVEAVEDENPELIPIGDATRHSECIKIQGYVKSMFAIIKKQNGKGSDFMCGSITDGEWKLEVRVPVDPDNDEDQADIEFEKGDPVQVVGFTQLKATPIHFMMKNMNHITKIDGEKMPLKNLLRGTKILEKPNEGPREHIVKKQKLNE